MVKNQAPMTKNNDQESSRIGNVPQRGHRLRAAALKSAESWQIILGVVKGLSERINRRLVSIRRLRN